MSCRSFLPIIFLVFFLPGCKWVSTSQLEPTNLKLFKSQIEAVNCDNAGRFTSVKKLFQESGASENDIEVEVFGPVENIVLTLKGKGNETVLVGAHYDKTSLGCGVIDNWTGIVILANLYRSLKTQRNEKTYKFIAFGKEERGLVGSKAMAQAIPEDERMNYCAMINLDSFGFENTWALEDISDKKLMDLGRKIAEKRNAGFTVKTFGGASSDSKSFRDIGIPAITFSGLNDSWREHVHKKGDQLVKINFGKVYENYLFAEAFLNSVDRDGCSKFR